MTQDGKRFNQGKNRIDLLPAWALEQVGNVFTMGAEKYGDRNWEKGMPWSKMIASATRHMNKIGQGEDFDNESGLHHAAHAATNLLMLLEYYKICPNRDDRQSFKPAPRIGLDIDGVLADFQYRLCRIAIDRGIIDEDEFEEAYNTKYWNISSDLYRLYQEVCMDREFYMGMPRVDKNELPFEPVVYITARPCSVIINEEWIEAAGLPFAPVVSAKKKSVACLEHEVEVFVDDSYHNFVELNSKGIFTYLFDKPYNRKHDVGHRRIKSLREVLNPQVFFVSSQR